MDQYVCVKKSLDQRPDNILFAIEVCFIQQIQEMFVDKPSLNLHSSFATFASLYFLGSAVHE